MAAATHSDVAVAIGRPVLTVEEQDQIQYWLAGVELLIKARFESLAALDQEALRYVETEAVAAKVGRGRESSISVTLDDGTVTRRYEGAQPSDIADSLWALLSPASKASAFTIGPFGSRQRLVGGDEAWL